MEDAVFDLECKVSYLSADASAIRLMALEESPFVTDEDADRIHTIRIMAEHQLDLLKEMAHGLVGINRRFRENRYNRD